MKPNLIAIAVDRGMFPPAAFLADRLAVLNPRDDVEIAIFSDAEEELARAKKFRVPAKLIHTKLPIEMVAPKTQRITPAAFLRLFITDHIDHEVRRILYLDADVYPETDALFGLFDLDMSQYPVAGVHDMRLVYTAKNDYLTDELSKARVPATKFLNGGVLLINREKYVSSRIGHRAFNLTVKYGHRVDIVTNRILAGNWLPLSPSMNAPMEFRSALLERGFVPVITHFVGKTKPWHGPAFAVEHPSRKEIEKYLIKSPWRDFLTRYYSFKNAWDSIQALRGGATFARPPAKKAFKLPSVFRRSDFEEYLDTSNFADIEQGLLTKAPEDPQGPHPL